ncbi:MAG TPA: LAGLIDADG family homing endonuclease [Patescibacteria group bacterium]|nr:LAGLIDADG family homing endonuclease [Patescibacteria group bacterium]
MKIHYPNIASEFVALRSYCRWLPELNRRENWEEVTERVIRFLREEARHADRIPGKVWTSIQEGMLNFSVMPSMRLVATAGPAAKKDNIALYNCSYTPIDSITSFSELAYILMCGTGVGFSVEKENIHKLPIIKHPVLQRRDDYFVEDTREGWANAIKFAFETWFNGEDVHIDYSRLRPYGTPLKTMGGRSSGPQPLIDLMLFAKEMINKAGGRKLSSLECHDICCKIAEIVVVGGTRRSSCISFSDINDDEMRHSKDHPFPKHRSMANNSVAYLEKPDTITFLREWSALAESGSGERGIFNLEAVKKQLEQTDRTYLKSMRCNPCQPGWSKVLTPNGLITIDELKVGHKIWSSEGWTIVTNKQSSGIKKVLEYNTSAGIFNGTSEHRIISNGEKIEVSKAKSIDTITGPYSKLEYNIQDVMDGLVIGDGSVHKASNNLVFLLIGKNDNDYFKSEIKDLILKHRPGLKEEAYEILTTITASELPKTYDRYIPNRFLINPIRSVGFLRGLYSANGSVCGNRITLKSSSINIIKDTQLLLNSLGLKSYYTINKPTKVKFDNGTYECKESYDLNITTDRNKFVELIGFIQQYKIKKIKFNTKKTGRKTKSNFKINTITTISTEEVFNLTVDNNSHTYWTEGCNVSNCGEVILKPYQTCNLSEAVIRSDDDISDLVEKVKTATWLGVIQSSFTYFPYVRSIWKKTCDEERIIGVSLTGQLDNSEILSDQVLKQLKKVVIKTAKHASDILKITCPKAYTTSKPSGTVSQVVDASSGCHPRYSKFYIRRYRISKIDPLFKLMKEQGVSFKPEVEQDIETGTTMVLEFPIKAPDKAITIDKWDCMKQMEWYLKLQKNWSTHNVSNTVYVKNNEWIKVGAWVYEHFDEIIGMSFLPYDDHKYELAPYEPITEEQYEKLLKTFPKIDFTKLGNYEKETGDRTEVAKTLACSGDKCELK